MFNRCREKGAQALKFKIFCDIGTVYGFKYSVEELEAVVALLPDLHSAHLELANAYLHAGLLEEAVRELDRAEELGFPIDAVIKNQRACIFHAKSDIENAHLMLETGIKTSPCRVIEQNYNKLKSWRGLPIHKRRKPPELDDSVQAVLFADIGAS